MREPTAEQKAKAQARREKMRAISKKIGAMSDDERAAFAKTCPVVTIDGRALSPHNQCMLAFQKPDVTVVGGFQQWRKAGRKVISGKGSGLAIWIPCGPKATDPETGDKETTAPEFFTLGTVFDVSQTADIGAPAEVAVAEPSKGYAFTPAEVAAATAAVAVERPF